MTHGYAPATRTRPTPPRPVRTAVTLVLARIALAVLGVIVAVVYDEQTVEASAAASGVDPGLARSFAGAGLVISVLLALVAVATWVVLALFTRRGHGWARIVLTVLGGLALLGALGAVVGLAVTASAGLPQAVPVGVVVTQQVLGLGLWAVTLVLLYRPASNAYFRDAAAVRAAAGHSGPPSAHQPT